MYYRCFYFIIEPTYKKAFYQWTIPERTYGHVRSPYPYLLWSSQVRTRDVSARQGAQYLGRKSIWPRAELFTALQNTNCWPWSESHQPEEELGQTRLPHASWAVDKDHHKVDPTRRRPWKAQKEMARQAICSYKLLSLQWYRNERKKEREAFVLQWDRYGWRMKEY